MSLFISYASADQSLAMEVCALLEARGVACWIAPRDVAPGAKWDEALMRAIDDCGAFLVLLSAASNDSPFVQNEVNRAFAKKKAIFTFRLDEVSRRARWSSIWPVITGSMGSPSRSRPRSRSWPQRSPRSSPSMARLPTVLSQCR